VQCATPGLELDDNDLAVATWAYEHGQPAGEGTDTLPAAALRCLPLQTARGTLGVIAVRRPAPEQTETPDDRRLLEAFVSQAALAIERVRLAEQAKQVEVLSATEKLQAALLNSVSHELRTPLATITGVLSSLREPASPEEPAPELTAGARAELVDTAWEEAQRLNRLVGNLLDMSRLQAGALKVKAEPCDLQDVVGASLQQADRGRSGGDRLQDRAISVDIPPDLPLVPLDFVLIVQVLVNLLDNALKYSPPTAPIDLAARVEDSLAVLTVADRGAGIPAEDLATVFDQFRRLPKDDSAGGTGLGLAICKGIVEAHGGQIRADHRPGGGTVITVALPAGNGNTGTRE
jgi:two-component system sensor histidine kinase KdpD